MKHTRVVWLNARQAKPGVHLFDTTRVRFIANEHATKCSCFLSHMLTYDTQRMSIYVMKYV